MKIRHNNFFLRTVHYCWNRGLKKIRGVAIKDSCVADTSKIEAGSQVINSLIDKYSFCGYDCKILNCSIGSYVSIADNVIIGGAQHPIDWVSSSPVFYYGRDSIAKKFSTFQRKEELRTVIGNDVWIGEGVYIKGGCSIGNGAVIGMGSVVTKNIGDYEIWAGNPAKFIRKRFNDDIITGLLESAWWNYDDETMKYYAKYIRDPKEFLCAIKEKRKLDNNAE